MISVADTVYEGPRSRKEKDVGKERLGQRDGGQCMKPTCEAELSQLVSHGSNIFPPSPRHHVLETAHRLLQAMVNDFSCKVWKCLGM